MRRLSLIMVLTAALFLIACKSSTPAQQKKENATDTDPVGGNYTGNNNYNPIPTSDTNLNNLNITQTPTCGTPTFNQNLTATTNLQGVFLNLSANLTYNRQNNVLEHVYNVQDNTNAFAGQKMVTNIRRTATIFPGTPESYFAPRGFAQIRCSLVPIVNLREQLGYNNGMQDQLEVRFEPGVPFMLLPNIDPRLIMQELGAPISITNISARVISGQSDFLPANFSTNSGTFSVSMGQVGKFGSTHAIRVRNNFGSDSITKGLGLPVDTTYYIANGRFVAIETPTTVYK